MHHNVDILEEIEVLPIGTTMAEEAPALWTPAEDARPSATEAAAKVTTDKKEDEARRDFLAMC